MEFKDFYSSVFAILRIEGQNGTVVGTGFVINVNPIYILTCNHVVPDATEENNGQIKYSITKRSDTLDDFDLRHVEVSYLQAKRIIVKPEFDLAILEIDPNSNSVVATKLGIPNARSLPLNFDRDKRIFGDDVQWLSPGAIGDLTLIPRLFKGNLIAHYTSNQAYEYKISSGDTVQQIIQNAKMLEIDKLFIPGSSGSPILNSQSNEVIGFVHGFRSWPIGTNTEILQPVQAVKDPVEEFNLKYKPPLITSISLGIDVRTIEAFLREKLFLPS